MADFAELESQDGVRMPWNVIPGTKQESSDCVVPVSAVYTPLHPVPTLQLLPYSPLRCRTCRSVLNPFCVVDYDAKIWLCPICYQRNHFPPSYNAISLNSVPAELYPTCTTVEYDVSAAGAADHAAAVPPVFLYVVDTCVLEEELGFLKSALAQAFELLPEKSLVGLVTFGAYVQVHELGYGHVPKCYVFKGTKEVGPVCVLYLQICNPSLPYHCLHSPPCSLHPTMAISRPPFFFFFFFFFFILYFFTVQATRTSTTTHRHPVHQPVRRHSTPSRLIRVSCASARYPILCIRTLSTTTAATPAGIAQVAVSASLTRVRSSSAFLSHLRSQSRRESGALRDCVEQLSDSMDQLRRTLVELRHLQPGTFQWQMSDVETWVSAALTNEDTCLDGFQAVNGSVKVAVKKKVAKIAHMTSNALYLINRLASTSP